MKWPLVIWLIGQGIIVVAQERPAEPVNEQQLEMQAEREEGVADDDTQWQQLLYLQKHPLNLNAVTENELKTLRLLSDLQISNFLLYRKQLGALLNIYELQAIPGWDVYTIKQLLPYVTVSDAKSIVERLGERLQHGEQTALLRFATTVSNDEEDKKATENYLGHPSAVLFRYKYNYKNLMQYGITGDKDAGEQFFKGAQKNGFDFYSFHFFARKLGIVQSLAIGDFAVGFGQGLIQWQGLAFKKSAEVLAIKRQGPALLPYNSAGEYNFHRGVGVTLQKNAFQCTVFASARKLSANLVSDSISSIQTVGYYRTVAELNDRYNVQCITAGGSVKVSNNRSHIAINTVQYNLSNPLQPADEPYDRYAISGRTWSNYSFDYSYTVRNMHVYGEVAVDKLYNKAMVHGLLASLDPRVDLAVVYRNISSRYQSLFSNAFTENRLPVNENGLYAGLSIRPVHGWRLQVYADVFKFPWLKYKVNAPSGGQEYLVQLEYTQNKYVTMYTRLRHEAKEDGMGDIVKRLNWRTHINYRLNKMVELRSRVETVWYGSESTKKETGFLLYTDVFVKPPMKPFFFNARLQYVETGGYNSRIYAWENTVMYNFSIPAQFNKSLRYILNVNCWLTRLFSKQQKSRLNCLLAFSFAQSVHPFKAAVEASENAVEAYNSSNIKMQLIFVRI
ncbi:ComEA family DNA-binding protein [Niastella sp. OAS944]|uniref:ComEA family DNA-binding protein n=1 Tax=Niastella sp. OAS944 TaxID=2664089 RepID=UPI003494B21D|nr:hypothetical protein [Chitinophagaceae bacterium OAS944]